VSSGRSLRASDADREQVAERLRHATTEGRLSADELDQRLDALYGSRTYGELDVLVADLPVPRTRRQPAARFPPWAVAACIVGVVVALFGVLVGAVRHSTAVVAGASHPIVMPPADPGAVAHSLLAGAVSVVSVLAVLIVLVAVVRLVLRSQRPSDV
jgi:DUF1707 SHOCT-like domain